MREHFAQEVNGAIGQSRLDPCADDEDALSPRRGIGSVDDERAAELAVQEVPVFERRPRLRRPVEEGPLGVGGERGRGAAACRYEQGVRHLRPARGEPMHHERLVPAIGHGGRRSACPASPEAWDRECSAPCLLRRRRGESRRRGRGRRRGHLPMPISREIWRTPFERRPAAARLSLWVMTDESGRTSEATSSAARSIGGLGCGGERAGI